MRIRIPATTMMPQKNGKQLWNVAIVSPQDATEMRCETDEGRFYDEHGNETTLNNGGTGRALQILRRYFRDTFGI